MVYSLVWSCYPSVADPVSLLILLSALVLV
jgi:hypothetical protein